MMHDIRQPHGSRRLNTFLLLASAAAAAMSGTAAVAQSPSTAKPAAPSSQAEPPTATEIVVTARRVSESLERVPLTVAALPSSQLAARSVTSQADLQRTVPGLTVRSGQSNNEFNYSIRGQSLDLFTGSQSAVLPYVNEVQATPFGGSSFYDLDSVQVLKGPQGTLFGRNATGGAVLFGTEKPTNDLGGFVTARGGNYALAEILGAVNIPIVPDKVLLRLAGDIEHRNGYQYNIYRDEHEGEIRRQSGRASLTLRPSDNIENITVVQVDHSGGNDIQLEAWSAYPCGAPGVSSVAACLYSPILDAVFGPGAYAQYRALNPLAQPGGYLDQVAFQKSLGPWKVNTLNPSLHRSFDYVATNTTSVELNDNLTFKNIAGVQLAKTIDNRDPIGQGPYYLQGQDPGPIYTGPGFTQKRFQYSEEAQLVGHAFDRSLNYVVGLYYGYQRDYFGVAVAFVDVPPFIPKTVEVDEFTNVDKTEGIYAQGTQDLSGLTGVNGLKFTAGIRYTWEQTELVQGPNSTVVTEGLAHAPINPAAPEEQASFSDPSWTLGLDWQVTPDLLLYITHRGSWRSGGFNGTGPARYGNAGAGGNEFAPETTYDVEIGEKYSGRLASMPFHVNFAIYNQWISDIQRAVFTTPPPELSPGGRPALSSLTVNIPSATVRGVELDTSLSPWAWLDVGGALSYTDAFYTNGTSTLFGSSVTFGPYADTPRWTGTVYTSVTLPTSEAVGKVVWRTDVYAQSSQYFSNLANTVAPQTKFGGYALVNMRVDWNVAKSRVTLSGFAKNLLNATNYAGGIAVIPFGANGVIPGEPRTYGAEATIRF